MATHLNAIAIPREALQQIDELHVVFVRKEAGVYEPRVVTRLGAVKSPEGGELALVEGNLRVGELVVTTGALLLRTEVVPNGIGADCADDHPPGGA